MKSLFRLLPLLIIAVAEVAIGHANADQFEPVRELIRRKLDKQDPKRGHSRFPWKS
jgi:hypothetical protein